MSAKANGMKLFSKNLYREIRGIVETIFGGATNAGLILSYAKKEHNRRLDTLMLALRHNLMATMRLIRVFYATNSVLQGLSGISLCSGQRRARARNLYTRADIPVGGLPLSAMEVNKEALAKLDADLHSGHTRFCIILFIQRKAFKLHEPIISRGDNMYLKKILTKWIKKMKWYDISLIKLAVFFATLFLVTVWPGFRDLVLGIAWYWYLVLMIVFAALPMKRMFFD